MYYWGFEPLNINYFCTLRTVDSQAYKISVFQLQS